MSESTKRLRLRFVEERVRSTRAEFYILERCARELRERVAEETAELDALMAQVIEAREAHRLAERALSIAREPRR